MITEEVIKEYVTKNRVNLNGVWVSWIGCLENRKDISGETGGISE